MRFQALFFILLLVCVSACNTKTAEPFKYPPGGYSYLQKVDSSDKDYYFLPLRKLLPLEDSMVYDRAKYFFKSFDEPNLSVKPAAEEIFRLSIEGFINRSTIIIVTQSGLIVKQTKKGTTIIS